MPAWWWSADIALAAVLVLLEGAALAAFCIAEGIKKWAAEGGHVEGADRRFWMVLTIGPAGLAAVSYATFQAGLLVTALSQALIGPALLGYLWLGRSSARRRTRPRRGGGSSGLDDGPRALQ
ncbi:hypothetical protein H9Y04_15030 [Streptomyces sp. TRM66268-LWL]|uniref:DUF6234 domain-containing protein n=1 Tax=Streptomyces polyasparticus TaxID=2767826 RepID=A0ABR7SFX0_9ACTN|nr:DUF6234 family protein [Streptomyces polyasparticus]MBC9713882.1 hypothetical protein [Streptomyces polyasparticus]